MSETNDTRSWLFRPVTLMMWSSVVLLLVGKIASYDLYRCSRAVKSLPPKLESWSFEGAALVAMATIVAAFIPMSMGLLRKQRNRFVSGLVALVGGLMVMVVVLSELRGERRAANESAAVANLRTIVNAQETLKSTAGTTGYGGIEELIKAGLIDSRFRDSVAGYRFAITREGESYTAAANAVNPNISCWDYFTNADGVIRYSTDSSRSPAGVSGMPTQ